ncbi:MAG: type III-B CRISPR module RAMP protein Cmr6 [Thermoproteota archaeon]
MSETKDFLCFLEEIEIIRTNIWSYIALSGAALCLSKGQKRDVGKLERIELEKIVKASGQAFIASREAIMKLLHDMEEALVRSGYEVRRVRARLASKGLFGAGESFGKIAFDIGLSFDPILNVPFIPGSSLKGAIRSAYASLQKSDNDKKRLFGSSEIGTGLIGVTDSYPIEAGEGRYILYPDVMTPHYRKPESKLIELESEPVPIVYLTVAPETMFQFYVYFKRERGKRTLKFKQKDFEGDITTEPKADIEELGLVDLSVIYALNLGVGAKTSAGYSALKIEEYLPVNGSGEIR